MTKIAVLLILITSASRAAPVDSLALHLDASIVRGVARIVASAENCSADTLKFCGRWSFVVDVVPTAEYSARMKDEHTREQRAQQEAAAAGRLYYSRGRDRSGPLVIDIGSLAAGAERWVTVAPAASFCDTLVFDVGTGYNAADSLSEHDRTGWLEVRYRLDLCEIAAPRDSLTYIPQNGAGGELVVRFPQR